MSLLGFSIHSSISEIKDQLFCTYSLNQKWATRTEESVQSDLHQIIIQILHSFHFSETKDNFFLHPTPFVKISFLISVYMLYVCRIYITLVVTYPKEREIFLQCPLACIQGLSLNIRVISLNIQQIASQLGLLSLVLDHVQAMDGCMQNFL